MENQTFELPKTTIEVLQAVNRLQAVDATGLTGEVTPESFQQICAMVSSVFNAPVAQITLLEEYRQCIKTSIGFDIKEAPTETSFCAYTISSGKDITIINDTKLDDIFKLSPFVVEPPYVRFYAGCPVAFEGEKVGTLCVYDFEPRSEVSNEQQSFMRKLALDAQAAIYGEHESSSTKSFSYM